MERLRNPPGWFAFQLLEGLALVGIGGSLWTSIPSHGAAMLIWLAVFVGGVLTNIWLKRRVFDSAGDD